MSMRPDFVEFVRANMPTFSVTACPECDGSGVDPNKENQWDDCSHCEGSGEVFTAPAGVEVSGTVTEEFFEAFWSLERAKRLWEHQKDSEREMREAEACRQRSMERGGPLNAYDGLD